MSYRIFNEDCLTGMERLEANSVDCIIADLPFNLTDCAWDKAVIDLPTLWTQIKRIIKPYSATVLFASGKFTHKLVASNFDWYKYKWIWVKNAPTMFVHAKNAPMRKFEEILVFSDGAINHASCSKRRMTYNPQGLTESIADKNGGGRSRYAKRHAFGNTYGKSPSNVDFFIQEQTNYPNDVLYYDVEPSTKKLHPTQKPVPLLEYLIRTYTDKGETVLDVTMGSGSTGVAAINTGRNFIGFEIDRKIFETAEKRIAATVAEKEQSLF